MVVNILGTEYEVVIREYSEDEAFKEREIDGYCDGFLKKIVVCDMGTYPGWEKEPTEVCREAEKHTLRHETVHAFFNESGLKESSAKYEGGWARFEELVDWIAIQGPKIYAAWQSIEAL